MTAYPSAKIILTVRDEESWYESMTATLWRSHTHSLHKSSPLSDKYNQYCWNDDFPAHGREYYHKFMELVRSTAPKDRLLEFNVSQGWQPLCDFLGKAVPESAFPRHDDWAVYRAQGHW